jgi:hypothetical protein
MNELKVTGREKIGSIEFTGIEGGFGEGKKAMLVKDIAAIHETEVRRINEVINRNRNRFVDGKDIIDLKSAIVQNDSEIIDFGFTQNAFNASKNIYLLSERGYSKLLKILEDDKAWEIYDELVDNYFNMRQTIKMNQPQLPQSPMEVLKLVFDAQTETNERVDTLEIDMKEVKENQPLQPGEYSYIQKRVSQRVHEIAKGFGKITQEVLRELFKDINGGIKKVTGVSTRTQLKARHFQTVIDFIQDWEPSTATKMIVRQTALELEA